MSDTISRQAALDALGDEPEVWTGKDEYAQGLNNQWHYDRNAIKALPTVDAAPIRHGEWVDVHFRTVPYDRITGAKKCPYCGKKKDKYVQWNWCPNCGAKLMNNKVSTTIGEWVDDGDPLTLVCGVCGYRVMRYNNTKFCPDCGAKMDGKGR